MPRILPKLESAILAIYVTSAFDRYPQEANLLLKFLVLPT